MEYRFKKGKIPNHLSFTMQEALPDILFTKCSRMPKMERKTARYIRIAMIKKNPTREFTMSKLLECTNNDIRNIFPRIKNLGASSFGEDADIFGATLAEVIENAPQGHDLLFKQQTVNELKNLLACNDAELNHASFALIAISPTEEVEEPSNWGSFPTLRAFWSATLHSFEHDPEVQAGKEIDPDM